MSNYIDKVSKDGVEYDIHASNGGTKWYEHYITFDEGNGDKYIKIVSTNQEPISKENITDDLLTQFLYYNGIGICYNLDGEDTTAKIVEIQFDQYNQVCCTCIINASLVAEYFSIQDMDDDIVTPL